LLWIGCHRLRTFIRRRPARNSNRPWDSSYVNIDAAGGQWAAVFLNRITCEARDGVARVFTAGDDNARVHTANR
jgi:hypothetical protein